MSHVPKAHPQPGASNALPGSGAGVLVRRRAGLLLAVAVLLAAVLLAALPSRHPSAAFARQQQPAALQTVASQTALDAALRAVAARPHDASALLRLASLYAAQGDLGAAISQARTAAASNPRLAPPHAALGDLYSRAGELDRSIDELRAALALQPNDASAAALLAYQYLTMGWATDAATLLRRSLKTDPRSANLHGTLGLVEFQLHDLGGAERELLEARRLAPGDPSVVAPLFDVYQNWQRPADALRVVNEALAGRPGDARLLARKAQAYVDLGDFHSALDAANEALATDLHNMNAVYVRALAEHGLGDRATATRDLADVAEQAPAGPVLILLGQWYVQAGERDRGLTVLARGRRMSARISALAADIAGVNAHPSDPAAHLAAARAYAESHEHARAVVEIKSVLRLRPNDTAARALLRQELLAAGRADEAASIH